VPIMLYIAASRRDGCVRGLAAYKEPAMRPGTGSKTGRRKHK
jgi:hypothetical protein